MILTKKVQQLLTREAVASHGTTLGPRIFRWGRVWNFMTNLREQIEAGEHEKLISYACFASESKGKKYSEEDKSINRTDFQRDRDRVLAFDSISSYGV
jgi:hypothetical protein